MTAALDPARLPARLLADLVDRTEAGVVLLDHHWTVVYVNAATARANGVDGASLIGRNAWELWPETVGTVFEREYRRAMTERVPVEFTAPFPALGVTLECRAYPDEGGGICVVFRDVTEQHRVAEALETTLQRLDLVLDAAAIGTWDWDVEHDLLQWDARAKTLFGWPAAFVVTHEATVERVHPDDRERLARSVAAALAPEGTGRHDLEYRVLLADGTVRWLRAVGQARFSADGGPRRAMRFSGTLRDVTAQRARELRARVLVELADATRALDEPRAIVLASMRLLREHLGAERCAYAEVEADEDHFVFLGDDCAAGVPTVEGRYPASAFGPRGLAALRAGRSFVVNDAVHELPEGGDRAVYEATGIRAFIAVPVHRGGRLVAGTGVHMLRARRWTPEEVQLADEVTQRCWEAIERGRAERARRESEARFRMIFEHATTGIAIADAAGRFVQCNPAYARLLGYTEAELLQRDFPSLVHADDRAANLLEVRRLLRREQRSFTIENRYVRKDGAPVWVYKIVSLLEEEVGGTARLLVLVTDVTERRAAEQRLLAAQRMEAAGRIAGGVAHEANNQMTVVLGSAHFMGRHAGLPPEVREDLAQVVRAAERTARICQQLLAFSRQQVLRPVVLRPDAVVREASALLGRTLGERSTLHLELGAEAGCVRVDRGQLEQVLLNLVLNARDAMPEGGTVTLASREARVTSAMRATLGLTVDDEAHWHLTVTDTGLGMDRETLARVFEPFFTTKGIGVGTGLGLSVVQGVLRQSGGDVAVESVPGQGTTVHVVLPLAADATDVREPTSAAAPAKGGALVWVVEDEPDVRAILARVLADAGYGVRFAASGREVLDWIGEGTPPDCVVTDVVMPGLQGPALVAALRARWPALPALLISGYPESDLRPVQRSPRDAVLAKPFQPEELVRRVADLLAVR